MTTREDILNSKGAYLYDEDTIYVELEDTVYGLHKGSKEWFEKRGLYKKARAYGGDYAPKKGDIIFFSSGYTQKDSTHVGIVTSLSGNAVSTIEGNTSNRVARRSYSVASKYIIGYGVPEYNEGYDTYTVKKGDSLWKIAKEVLGNGMRYSEIMEINNMEDAKIFPGDSLYLPRS